MVDTTDGINSHLTSSSTLWEVPPITESFKQIFNTDTSGDEDDTGSGIYNDSFDLQSPLGDPLALTLPSLSFATPHHEFSRQYSLSRDSPSEFDQFTADQLVTPTRVYDYDDLMGSPGRVTKPEREVTPTVDLEKLLSLDTPAVNDAQFQDIIIDTVSNISKPMPPSLDPLPMATTRDVSLRKLDLKSASNSDIVDTLNQLISSNDMKVGRSRVLNSPAMPPPPKVAKPRPKKYKNVRNVPKSTPMPDPKPVSKTKLILPKPASQHKAPSKTRSVAPTSSKTGQPTRSRAAQSVFHRPESKQTTINDTLAKSGLKRKTPEIMSMLNVKKNIANKVISNKISAASAKHVIVPYTGKPSNQNKKYLLVPVEKLQNCSPSLISQLGIQSSVIKNVKRSLETDDAATSDKRPKTNSFVPDSLKNFAEKTEFPIKIKLPESVSGSFLKFPETIPEMIGQAKAKRKAQRSKLTTFTQMESFINDFIQQNNEQVVEILFLKQNNKELNRKYNNLSKVFHLKSVEQKRLREEIDHLKNQNKHMEKELKSIKDMIKKYIK